MISETDFAYLAGYIDGDGCFHIGSVFIKRKNGSIYEKFRANLIICSTHLPTLKYFRNIFGGRIQKTTSKPTHKFTYHFILDKKHISNIFPYLIEKKKECAVFMEYFKCTSSKEKSICRDKLKQIKQSNIVEDSIKEELQVVKNTLTPTSIEWSYLAGFIDAECCFMVQRDKPKSATGNPIYKILLQCNNTKTPCFYFISKYFGGQFYFIDRSKYKNHRNQMNWRISAKELSKIVRNIFIYLIQKKQTCQEIINFYDTTFKPHGFPSANSSHFYEAYAPIAKQREEIYHKIKLLNKKGSV